jgi:hypothetical protein
MQVKVARTRSFHQNRNLRERILSNFQVKKKLLNVQKPEEKVLPTWTGQGGTLVI